jgi:hypothetical protein
MHIQAPRCDQIAVKLIQGGDTLLSHIHKNGDKTYCNNYRGISRLSTSYKILSNILSRLSPHTDKITGDR